jgi:hypothetical protein
MNQTLARRKQRYQTTAVAKRRHILPAASIQASSSEAEVDRASAKAAGSSDTSSFQASDDSGMQCHSQQVVVNSIVEAKRNIRAG